MKSTPNYKTAEELGIEQWEHDGLVALVGPLSRDVLRLDMAVAGCDSIHCIGGWVAANAGADVQTYVGFSRPTQQTDRDKGTHSAKLYGLFFPEDETVWCDVGGWLATAPQAARAIVNFLVTGDPAWDRVMSEPAQP